jgi:hypothetical protein
MELGDFIIFQKKLLKLDYARPIYQKWIYKKLGFLSNSKLEIIKISSRIIASVMEIFYTFFQYKVHLNMFYSSPMSKIWYTST